MKVEGLSYRSIWFDQKVNQVKIIDQRWLPHRFDTISLLSLKDFQVAIRDMWVRGAPLIGATAAYGIAIQMKKNPSDSSLEEAWHLLYATRPTAINLKWALDRCKTKLLPLPECDRSTAAMELAHKICDEDVEINRLIGYYGLDIIKDIAKKKNGKGPVRILTHCNAGWLATVDWGTATSPMYHAFDAGIDIHVWVDETRPRNQGSLTSWELGNHGIPHQYIVDNAGGHLMQHGLVDLVITGTDRTTAAGDVCNKIGTYLKALAANDNSIPFYVALPSSTIDWTINNGILEIPIEERSEDEVLRITGKTLKGDLETIQVSPSGTKAGNPAFDVTPSRLVTGLITERGVSSASKKGLEKLFPEFVRG